MIHLSESHFTYQSPTHHHCSTSTPPYVPPTILPSPCPLQVASELNAAILRLESSSDPTTRLETLLKLLLWAQGQLDQKKVRYPRMTDLASGALDD